jgi:uncharacterized SAM-binding protein YcdF (DUF218 family)
MRNAQRGGIILKLMGLIIFLFLLGVVYLARHPLLRTAGRFWIVDEAPQPSDAIVILGDDNYSADRAARAAELYRARWAPRIVASGRFLRPYASIADLMQRDLVGRGVPADAVIRFTHHANDTREELGGMSHLISERGWRRIIVVTSNYHTRRARYILERTFPPGVELRVVAAPDSEYDPASWWTSRLGIKLFFHEVVGMVVAIWELRHSSVSSGAAATWGLGGSQAPGWSGVPDCSIDRLYLAGQFTAA